MSLLAVVQAFVTAFTLVLVLVTVRLVDMLAATEQQPVGSDVGS